LRFKQLETAEGLKPETFQLEAGTCES